MSKIYVPNICKRKAERLGLQKDKIGYYYIEPIECTTLNTKSLTDEKK